MPSNSIGAVITGASSGLGRELARQFSAGGYHIIISGRNRAELLKTRDICMQDIEPSDRAFPGAVTIVGDLRERTTIESIADMASLFRAKYLVSCAAMYQKSPITAADPTCDILLPNLVATIDLVKAIYPVFISEQSGAFVNINSVAGKVASEQEAIYAASKHGLTGFFGALRHEARRKNIRVLDVFVGKMKTPMMQSAPDFEYLIDPVDAAKAIYTAAVTQPASFQIDELTLSRFSFPK